MLLTKIDYDLQFFILDMILMTLARILHAGVICYDRFSPNVIHIGHALAIFFSKYFYELTMYVGVTYYCALLQILKQQLQCLKSTRKEQVKCSFLHCHLLQCGTSIHRSYRGQIMFSAFHTTMKLIYDLVFLHERTLGFVNGESSLTEFLASVLHLFFRVHLLHNILKMGYIIRKSADVYLTKSYMVLQRKRRFDDKLLRAYVISKPRFNNSIGGYFTSNVGNLISVSPCDTIRVEGVGIVEIFEKWDGKSELSPQIVSGCGLYYLLMVQLNVIKSEYVP